MPPKPSNPDPISDPKRHFLHSIVSQGGEVLTYTLGGGVPPKPSNPDPLSDPEKSNILRPYFRRDEILP